MREYKDKNWFRDQYVVLNKSAEDIARICGCSISAVRYWAIKHNISRRRLGSSSLNDTYFDTIDDERKAYWLGFLAADGSISDRLGKRTVSITLAKKDEILLERFRHDIGSNKRIYPKGNKGKKYVIFDVASLTMVNSLLRLGLMPRKSLVLKPPEINRLLYRHWIRGYFDGDGSVSIDKKRNLSINVLGTQEVLGFIKRETNLNVSVLPKKGTRIFSLSAHGNRVCRLFYELLYKNADLYLERKKRVFQRRLEV